MSWHWDKLKEDHEKKHGPPPTPPKGRKIREDGYATEFGAEISKIFKFIFIAFGIFGIGFWFAGDLMKIF